MSLADGRNVALMYFLVIAIGVTLGPGVAFFFAIKGLRIVRRKIVPYIRRIQSYVRRVERATDRASLVVAQPILLTSATSARLKFHLNQFFSFLRREEG